MAGLCFGRVVLASTGVFFATGPIGPSLRSVMTTLAVFSILVDGALPGLGRGADGRRAMRAARDVIRRRRRHVARLRLRLGRRRRGRGDALPMIFDEGDQCVSPKRTFPPAALAKLP